MISHAKLNMLIKGTKFFRDKRLNLIKQSGVDQIFDKITDKEKEWVDELITELEEERDKLNKSKL